MDVAELFVEFCNRHRITAFVNQGDWEYVFFGRLQERRGQNGAPLVTTTNGFIPVENLELVSTSLVFV